MKCARLALSSAVLGGMFVVVPVVSAGAAPHAVAPSIDRVPMPAAVAVVDAAAATVGAPTLPPAVARPESVLTRSTRGADVVGVGFPDAAAAQGVAVSVRSQTGGRWGAWTPTRLTDSAPDPGSAEAAQARVATDPVGVTGSEEVQVRVTAARPDARLDRLEATFIDGGTSAADASLASVPAASATAAAVQPNIITRAQWGADESLRTCSSPDYVTKVKGAVVHHTVSSNTYTADAAAALLRSIYAYHVNGNGWCDVGYNFFVDRFGRLYEGRFGGITKNVVGAQAGGFNSQTFGVSSIANHDPGTAGAVAPTSAVLSAIGKLIGWKAWLNGWSPDSSTSFTSAGSTRWSAGTVITEPRVTGHREYSLTVCPGDLMYSKLSTIRSAAMTAYRGVTDVPAVAAPVVETYARPSGTSMTLNGRGFGHGRGMSQYGAYGAALKGLTNAQITAFYYPGTTRATTAGNPSIRVRLTEIGTGGTQVVYRAGLTASDGTRTISLNKTTAAGAQVTRWRVVPSGSGLSLQWSEGTWQTLPGWSALPGPVTLGNPTTGTVRVVLFGNGLRDYRGTVRTHRVGTGANTVNVTPLQSYLQGVVPSEMPPSWPTQALQAQAVAARTYALRLKASAAAGAISDICDSTACQVYRGAAEWTASGTSVQREWPSTTAAVAATSGVALTYGGSWILAEFTSSNGGQTVASSLAYQTSKADPYDAVAAGSTSAWTRNISLSTIEKAYPATGTFQGLRVDSRDGIALWGGRTRSVTVLGSAGSTKVTGDSFAAAMGLRSPWWAGATAPATSRATLPKDISSDSLADLLAVDGGGNLRVLVGNGNGAFTPVSAGTGWGGFDLITSAGAWTADNRHDVLARRGDTLYVYAGASGGKLTPRQTVSTGWSTRDLLLGMGDLDRDKHPDLVSRTTDGKLWLHRGDGAGHVLSTTSLGTGWQSMRTIVAPGDLTGDGIPDILAVRASDDALLLYPGNTSGRLSSRVAVTGSWAGYSDFIGPGDLNGDGHNDLVVRRSSDGALLVFAGDALGDLTEHHLVTGTATWASWTRWSR